MPVSIRSRYRGAPAYEAADAAGGRHPTLAIRAAAPPPAGLTGFRHILTGVETLEYLAWRYYGTSEAWWRIADANPGLFPGDWRAGATVLIPDAAEIGRIVRERTF